MVIRRAVIATLTCLAVIASGSAVAARNQRDKAQARARVSLSRQLASDSTLARSANLDRSLLLGVEAVRASPTVQARGALFAALQHDPGLVGYHSGGSVGGVAFSADGKTMATGGTDGGVLWDAQRFRRLRDPIPCGGQEDALTCGFRLSQDGNTLAIGGRDASVTLWDVPGWRPRLVLRLPSPSGGQVAKDDRFAVESLDVSRNSRFVAAATHVGAAVWDLETGQVLSQGLAPPEDENDSRDVEDVRFSPDSTMLATQQRGSVRFWDPRTLAPMGDPFGSNAVDLTFSPDGRTLASAGADGTVILWDVARSRPRKKLAGHRAPVIGVAFSPDGRTLASASDDATVILWDVGARRPLGTLAEHTAAVYGVAFGPDGRTLASVSEDQTVILWDVEHRRPLGRLAEHTAAVYGVAFSPDGRTLASASADRTVILWNRLFWSTDIGPLRKRLCRIVARNLTRAEWDRILPGQGYRKTCPQWPLVP